MNNITASLKARIVLAGPSVITVKKVSDFPFPNRQTGMHLPKSPCPGIIKLFPARESLVSDIPAGDGKIIRVFTV